MGAYKAGDLSLLLNPSAQPDVHIQAKAVTTKPAKVASASIPSAATAIDSAQTKKANRKRKNASTDAAAPNQQSAAVATVAESNDTDDEKSSPASIKHISEIESANEAKKRKRHHNNAEADEKDESTVVSTNQTVATGKQSNFATAAALRVKRKREDAEAAQLDSQTQQKQQSKKARAQEASQQRSDDPRLARTLFCGNIGVSTDRKSLAAFFAPHAAKQQSSIESIRFRSFAVADPRLSKRASFVSHQLMEDKKPTMNAYVVFSASPSLNVESIAQQTNGLTFDSHVIRVDCCVKSHFDSSRTVFVGSLPFDATEDELHSVFAPVCKDSASVVKSDEDASSAVPVSGIECVRIVRDPETNIGKGFAYVLFRSQTSVKPALLLHNTCTLRDRTLRVTRAMDLDKQEKVKLQKNKLLAHTQKSNKADKSSAKGKGAESNSAASSQAASVQKQAFQSALQKSIAAPRVKVKHAARKAAQAAAAGKSQSTPDAAAAQPASKPRASKPSGSSLAASHTHGGRNSVKRSFEGERAKPQSQRSAKNKDAVKKTTFAEAQQKYAKSLVRTKSRSRSRSNKNAATIEAAPSTQ